MTVLAEQDQIPHNASNGGNLRTNPENPNQGAPNIPPNLPVPAPPQVSSHGVTKQKRLRDFLKKTIIYSQNIQIQGSGRNQKEDTDTYKFDHITSLMEMRGIDIYLVQETWLNNEYKSHSVVNGYYLFHHGTNEASSDSIDEEEEENPLHQKSRKGHTKGGVVIFLSPKATAAWKCAGQHDPIVSGNTHGCARYIALKLHFIDHFGEIVKVNTCSVYHPTTKLSQQKRLEFLDELDNLYDRLDLDDHILIAGCDTNSSIGTCNSSYCHPNGAVDNKDENREIIGPHGIDHMNEAGVDLMNLMKSKNLAAGATTFFQHKDYTTWRSFNKTNEEREDDGESMDPTTQRQFIFNWTNVSLKNAT
jgi:exonuclease III